MCLQWDNNIGNEGCKHLAPVLPLLVKLTELYLVRDMDDLGVSCVMLGVLVPLTSRFLQDYEERAQETIWGKGSV